MGGWQLREHSLDCRVPTGLRRKTFLFVARDVSLNRGETLADITRLFKGPRNEFEVEIVFAQPGENSPKEGHTFDEILLLLEGAIRLELGNEDKDRSLQALDLVKIPPGVEHVIKPQVPIKLLVIHPERTT